jgi:probable F420-dependent oxidoreductase
MKFGVVFANVGPMTDPEVGVALAQAAEEAGFNSIWTVEHVVIPHGYQSTYPYDDTGKMPAPEQMDLPDPLIWLTWMAACTQRIRLATGILILPQRNPIVTAKEVATLDRMSGGRVDLGVGVGWLEEEFDILGVPFEGRGRRLDDYIAAMRALWTEDLPTHHGEFTSFEGAVCRPQPAQGTVPIHIGGHTKIAARRAGRIGDGFFPGRSSHEELALLLDEMRAAAKDAGRDPDAIEVSAGGAGVLGAGALDEVTALADLGVHQVLIPPLAFDAAGLREGLARYGEDVIARS